MSDEGEIVIEGLGGDEKVIGANRGAGSFEIGAKAPSKQRVFGLENETRKVGKGGFEELARTFRPAAFLDAIFKLMESDDRKMNFA